VPSNDVANRTINAMEAKTVHDDDADDDDFDVDDFDVIRLENITGLCRQEQQRHGR
jgi:hypothetical protein